MTVNRNCKRWWVGAMVATLALGGCYRATGVEVASAVTVAELQAQREQAENERVQANFYQFVLALEEHAVEHNAVYPRTDDVMVALRQNGYLPNGVMPSNPWSAYRQENVLRAADAPGQAGALGFETVLGTGKVATSSTYDALTFGAMVYERSIDGKSHVAWAIGKRGDQAVVVAQYDARTGELRPATARGLAHE